MIVLLKLIFIFLIKAKHIFAFLILDNPLSLSHTKQKTP